MFKKKLDWLSEKLTLGIWIAIIFLIMVVGSTIIIFHINNRFANLVTFIGSLIGGLITLISVSVTNRYYNQQKLVQDKEDKKEKIELKLNALKFLKKEMNANKDKFSCKIIGGKFQSAIWEEFRKEFLEIFINYPEKELSNLQEFYTSIMEQNNSITTNKLGFIGLDKLFDPIEKSIDKAIGDYQTRYDKLI